MFFCNQATFYKSEIEIILRLGFKYLKSDAQEGGIGSCDSDMYENGMVFLRERVRLVTLISKLLRRIDRSFVLTLSMMNNILDICHLFKQVDTDGIAAFDRSNALQIGIWIEDYSDWGK